MNKIKLLMEGPGSGHNIQPWLEYVNSLDNYEVTFLCPTFNFDIKKFTKLKIVPYPTSTSKFYKFRFAYKIRQLFKRENYDVFIMHGAGSSIIALILKLCIKHNKSILFVYGDSILDRSHHGSLKDRIIYKILFNKLNCILFGWFGTLEKFELFYPKYKGKKWLLFLGLTQIWFSKEIPKPSKFVECFMSSIPRNKRICIWPKSIIYGNRFDLVIQAINALSKANPNSLKEFLLILWGGNNEDVSYKKELKDYIKENDLTDIIKIIDHPFLEFSDMVHIVSKSDFYINFGDTDQLSNTVIEAMLFEKPIVLSNIQPYRLLNEKFDLHLTLVENDVKSIAEAFDNLLSNGLEINCDIFKKRKHVVTEYFQFEKDVQELFLKKIPTLITK